MSGRLVMLRVLRNQSAAKSKCDTVTSSFRTWISHLDQHLMLFLEVHRLSKIVIAIVGSRLIIFAGFNNGLGIFSSVRRKILKTKLRVKNSSKCQNGYLKVWNRYKPSFLSWNKSLISKFFKNEKFYHQNWFLVELPKMVLDQAQPVS